MKKVTIMLSRKMKYGSVSVLITVLFLAAVIIFNVIFGALASKYMWYVDMTPDQLYTIGDASRQLLGTIDPNKKIRIIFCNDPDKIDEKFDTRLVHNTAKEYALEFDNVTVEYVNSVRNPSAVTKYKTTSASNIYTTDVIIESGTEFRVFSVNAFYVVNESNIPWAYNGERKLTSAMLSVTQTDSPIAYFTSNHGEAATYAILELLVDAGYDVRTIDLLTEEIDPDCRLIVIHNPASDFVTRADGSDISEIEKIDRFLDANGSLMVFLNPDSREYKNLEEYLAEWGVKFERQVIRDTANSLTTDGYTLVAEYTDGTLGASIHKDLRALPSPPKSIVKYAMPISFTHLYDANGNYYSSGVSRDISTVLVSSAKAEAWADGKIAARATEIDRFNLMTLTRETRMVNNEAYYSYVLAAGSANFNDETFILSNTYANRDLMYSALRAMGKEYVPAGIDFKPFANNKIENMTTSEANQWTIFLTCAIPAVIFLFGLFIIIKRRRS